MRKCEWEQVVCSYREPDRVVWAHDGTPFRGTQQEFEKCLASGAAEVVIGKETRFVRGCDKRSSHLGEHGYYWPRRALIHLKHLLRLS
jgi:hypothetical protein